MVTVQMAVALLVAALALEVANLFVGAKVTRLLGELKKRLDAQHDLDRPAQVRLRAADLGIALAERMSKIQRGPAGEKRLQSDDKVRMAVGFAVEYASAEGVEFTPAEARKTIEARLEQLKVAKTWNRTK